MREDRVDWVDVAKGLCIIMVVMVHSVLGVEEAVGRDGWMHQVVAFARPFRMPDFFLISGLFLGLVIDRPLRRYVDRKVVHFAYFYVLWLAIQFAFKAPGMAIEGGAAAPVAGFAAAFVQPFGTLWFIYLLPLFFLVTRLLRHLPPWLVLCWAAILEMLPLHTGWIVADEFAGRYVYFFAGYALSAHVFGFADAARRRPAAAIAALAAWAVLDAVLVFTPAPEALAWLLQAETGNSGRMGGWAELPAVSLLLGASGALAVVAVSALVARLPWSGPLRWLGEHSIVIYLAFFLPMATTRAVLVGSGLIADVGTMSLITTAAAVVGPVVLYALVQWSGSGRFLFERPEWARLPETGPAPARA